MGFIQLKLPKRITHKIENSTRNREALAQHKTLKKRLKNFKGFDIPKYAPDPNQPKCGDKIPVGTGKSKEKLTYSGERRLLGIATMHKSNMVPVWEEQDAKDIARMRR